MYPSIWQNLTQEKKQLIQKFSLIVIGLYVLIIGFSALTMFNALVFSNETHALRMNPTAAEPGKTPPDPLPASGNFARVKVGTYFEDIQNLSIRDSAWSTNFYIWFSWKGDAKLDPGGKFEVVDGAIRKKELLEDYHDPGGYNYQRFRVSATITKFFTTSRVPLEDHMLNVFVEDGSRDGTKLRYVADDASNISSRLNVPGYTITGNSYIIKNHTYKTNYGDPKYSNDHKRVFSQYIAAIQIKRIDFGFYCKIFLSLFAAILLALSSFYVNPADTSPRFSLPTGAFFGAVANSYLANSLLPTSGSFGLVDHISGIGLFTIFIAVLVSLLSCHYNRHDEKALAIAFDRTMFWVVGLCCIAGNIIIPLCARG